MYQETEIPAKELSMNGSNEPVHEEVFGPTHTVSREGLVLRLGEVVVCFFEEVHGVSRPDSEEDSPSTAWRGLEVLDLEGVNNRRELQETEKNPLEGLTDEQQEIADLLVKGGKTREEIAEAIDTTKSILKKEVDAIFAAFGISSREELGRLMPVDSAEYEGVSMRTLNKLTVPQAKLLGCVAFGEDNRSIANRLELSTPRQVRERLTRMYARLDIKDRCEAARVGMLLRRMAEQSLLQIIGARTETLTEAESNMRLSRLSETDTELLSLVAQDKPRQEIVDEMSVNSHTISNSLIRVKSVLGVNTIEEAISLRGLKPRVLGLEDFYKLSISHREIFSRFSQGLSPQEIAKERGTKKRIVDRGLQAIGNSLGIQTRPILRLAAEANMEILQRGVTSEYHRAGLTGEQIVVVRLALQGLSCEEIGDTLSISEDAAEKHVDASLNKLGVSDENIFEASLRLEPPGPELIEGLSLPKFSPLERKIFLKMADNPAVSKLAKEFNRSESDIGGVLDSIGSNFNMLRPLQLARLSYAYQQYSNEYRQYKLQSARNQRLRKARKQELQELQEARVGQDGDFKPIVSLLVEGLLREGGANKLAHMSGKVLEVLDDAGFAFDRELVRGRQATLAGIAVALLLSTKLNREMRTPGFREVAIEIIKAEVREQGERQAQKNTHTAIV